MKIFTTIKEFRQSVSSGSVLIPTMGALHEGHLSLVRRASEFGLPVTVSIFVNPTQFGPNEDFARYPRNLSRDASLLEKEGVTSVFAPEVEEVYSGQSTSITAGSISHVFEGAVRPGHFDGVATIVCKLINIVQPSAAIFGLKDLQQCVVIRKVTRDLNMPVKLYFSETMRESNGLAMSSRNEYLAPTDRHQAAIIYRLLIESRLNILAGNTIETVLDSARTNLASSGFGVDYFELIDVENFVSTRDLAKDCALITAVRAGTTRLIDNVLLFSSANMS